MVEIAVMISPCGVMDVLRVVVVLRNEKLTVILAMNQSVNGPGRKRKLKKRSIPYVKTMGKSSVIPSYAYGHACM